ncbi:hypothetical protein FOL47_001442 [Perkinsus chesapeaki]|uniref:N-acetyltransferase domain-containing protein n=1 Tax=Perkinsus chesapeaki TaxID=330153 RepID=A0A7J6MK51_PERCH|nr:hypothetical protein FOL47_001442 [Perkinsus chesapeaki]
MNPCLLIIIYLIDITHQTSLGSAQQSKPLAELTAADLEYRPLRDDELPRKRHRREMPLHDERYFAARIRGPGSKNGKGIVISRLSEDDLPQPVLDNLAEKTKDDAVVLVSLVKVDEALWNKGIASRMFPKALEDKWPKVMAVYLSVKDMNKYAIRLYEKNGFKCVGKDPTSAKGFPWYIYEYPTEPDQAPSVNDQPVPKPASCGPRTPGVHITCTIHDDVTSTEARQGLLKQLRALPDPVQKKKCKPAGVVRISANVLPKPGASSTLEMQLILSALQQIKANHPDLTFAVVSMEHGPAPPIDDASAPDSLFRYIGQDSEFPPSFMRTFLITVLACLPWNTHQALGGKQAGHTSENKGGGDNPKVERGSPFGVPTSREAKFMSFNKKDEQNVEYRLKKEGEIVGSSENYPEDHYYVAVRKEGDVEKEQLGYVTLSPFDLPMVVRRRFPELNLKDEDGIYIYLFMKEVDVKVGKELVSKALEDIPKRWPNVKVVYASPPRGSAKAEVFQRFPKYFETFDHEDATYFVHKF